jgi:hypothetical protein
MRNYLTQLKARSSGQKRLPGQPSKPSKAIHGGTKVGFDGFEGAQSRCFLAVKNTYLASLQNPQNPAFATVATLPTVQRGDDWDAPIAWDEVPENRADTHEDSAAAVECDAGLPRSWAEGFARLDLAQPPGDILLRRWRIFIDDAASFLDSGWAARAAALGWDPLDLFGCDKAKPFARIDRMGLLWIVNGRRLIALTENTATIESSAGARLNYRRTPDYSGPNNSDRVLVWELER